MSSFLDQYRVGKPKWLVYYNKGEILVSKGYSSDHHTFVLADRNTWLTTAPYEPMTLSKRGRVLVENEEDIPEAKRMIYEHYIGKIDDIKEKATLSLYNIQKMIMKEGDVNVNAT